MLRIFIASICVSVLPAALSYTIKVQGNIELGNQVADLFKELRDRFLEENGEGSMNSDIVRQNPKHKHHLMAPSSDNYGMPVPKDFSFLGGIPYLEKGPENEMPLQELKDLPLLEEIIRNKEKRVHVYGKHKIKKEPKSVKPLNNIQV